MGRPAALRPLRSSECGFPEVLRDGERGPRWPVRRDCGSNRGAGRAAADGEVGRRVCPRSALGGFEVHSTEASRSPHVPSVTLMSLDPSGREPWSPTGAPRVGRPRPPGAPVQHHEPAPSSDSANVAGSLANAPLEGSGGQCAAAARRALSPFRQGKRRFIPPESLLAALPSTTRVKPTPMPLFPFATVRTCACSAVAPRAHALERGALDLESAGLDGVAWLDRQRSGARAEARRRANRLRSDSCSAITRTDLGAKALAASRRLRGVGRRPRFEVAAGARIPVEPPTVSWARMCQGHRDGTSRLHSLRPRDSLGA